MIDYRYKEKKERMKMKNLMVIMNRAELADIMYPANAEYGPDTLVGIAALGGDLLDEARANGNVIDEFCYMGDEGEFIEVDADGYVISDFLYY